MYEIKWPTAGTYWDGRKQASIVGSVTLKEEQMERAKREEKETNVQLRSPKDKMIALLLGEDDPDVIE